jgi:hypothetical protein
MQSTLPPEDDGQIVMQRLTPDQFDVVLGSHPGKRKLPPTKSAWPLSSVLIFLALLSAIVYLVIQMFHTQKPASVSISSLPTAEVTEESEPATQTADIRTTEQVVYVAPRLDTAQPIASKPLDDCMKQGNVIDRDVINCRFGDAQPTDYNAPPPQGMVSDRYLAHYKATAAKPQVETGRRYEVAGVLIREVDGRNRYEARYRIYNNHVENNSVCMNFKADSVEYRECRRAAAPYFKDMCSDWTKRAAKNKDDKNKLAQEQFCEAANTYRP